MQEVNVRVAVRVRPLLPKETLSGEQTCVRVVPRNNQLILGKDRAFTYDYVLTSKTQQADVYSQCVAPLVQNCFDGYNATVFAYGQTGSGKTFTIGGGHVASQTEAEFGVLPRAIIDMYDIIKKNHNREYTVKVSYIESYCEELRDLLDTDTSSKDLHIREDDKGNTSIVGTTELECESLDEVMSCLEQGAIYRHTGSTAMNDQSSRSHSVFTILIEQRWVDNDLGLKTIKGKGKSSEVIEEDAEVSHYMCAKFHFVDLAGSERAHRTGNVGDRLKESIHINSGLLALGNVISALADGTRKKTTHIPYRDSKITRLLKDSLGGNANTVMICCISPAASNFDESLNALKYANRARNIRNKPIVNRDPQSIRFEEMQTEIKALREELHRQQTSVVSATAAEGCELKSAIKEVNQTKEIEEKASRLQTECSHYRMVAEEAYKQLMEIQGRDVLTTSMNVRLADWLELMEEIKNKVPATLTKDAWETKTINKLQGELLQCKNDLKNDEEIFAEKAREVNALQDKIAKLEQAAEEGQQQLEELHERLAHQEEQLVTQQVALEEVTAKLKEREALLDEMDKTSDELELTADGPPTTTRRAKSVPASMLGNRNQLAEPAPQRNIHTSPALFSVERVMAGFRARSQLLVGRLEDGDDVLQPAFSDDEEPDDKTATETPTKEKQPFQRNTKQRGTYKVSKPKIRSQISKLVRGSAYTNNSTHTSQTDDEKWHEVTMRSSTEKGTKGMKIVTRGRQPADQVNVLDVSHIHTRQEQQKQLRKAEVDMRMSTQKARDLSINIRLKEQLIKELVKSGKEASAINHQYEEKIHGLEREKTQARQDITNLQKALTDLEQRESQDRSEKERMHADFRKKMELAKTRLHTLSKKQKDTERIATITGANNKRIQELESAVDKMKQQQDQLARKLKDESERKSKLERDMAKEQQRVRELEVRNAQQKKVLKVKTEEMAAVQRRLRSGNQMYSNRISGHVGMSRVSNSEEQSRIENQRRWIDSEIEKVVEQRRQIEQLEKDLGKREEIVMKKEAMLNEKSELEMKKLRSSQVISKDIKTVSMKLDSVDRRIQEKRDEVAGTPREYQGPVHDELRALQIGREKLCEKWEQLDTKLQEGAILSAEEERRLIGLDEYIDALDAAIDYKNDLITNRQHEMKRSPSVTQSEDNLMTKLKSLSAVEMRTLLSRYFDKVIELRDTDRKKNMVCSELQMRLDDQDGMIRELEATVQRAGLETDRRLTQQQQKYERQAQVMVRQIAELSSANSSAAASTSSIFTSMDKDKVTQLERDLYYYKKTSRDLKKKLRELLQNAMVSAVGDADREIDSLLMPTPRDLPREAMSPRALTPQQHSARSKDGDGSRVQSADRLAHLRETGGGTPVRISRKDLRRMSDEEVTLRKSAVRESDVMPQDSLDT